ncbi:hypothetical protein EMGBS11_05760 [Actinomycetota bacterium]|nr:hypothetical protein EMGBS11_05760 [Actinomycetota bacterium]
MTKGYEVELQMNFLGTQKPPSDLGGLWCLKGYLS